LLGPPVRERGRNWSGERERDAREGLGSFKSRPRSGRRAHDARGAGAVAARPPLPVAGRAGGRWGEELTSGPGWQRLRAKEARRLGWRGSLGRAAEARGGCAREKGSWAGGCQGNGLRAENKERRGRRKKELFSFFQRFSKFHFQLDFEFIWNLNQNHSSQK